VSWTEGAESMIRRTGEESGDEMQFLVTSWVSSSSIVLMDLCNLQHTVQLHIYTFIFVGK
jgi:hypothetical protein